MSVQLFVGEAPQNIKQQLVEDYYNRRTRIWLSTDDTQYKDILINGKLNNRNIDRKIVKIKTGNSVSNIDSYAFQYSRQSLLSAIVTDGVSSIGMYAFDGCANLKSVDLQSHNLIYINNNAFMGCNSLENISIPNSLLSIGRYAFRDCGNLSGIYISDLEAWCNIDFDDNPLIAGHNLYLNGQLITDLIIPYNITHIKRMAFSGSHIMSVTLHNNISDIDDSAFIFCTNLQSIIIPNSVTHIGNSAFEGCNSLTSVTIPDSITSIEPYTFEDCTGLMSVTIPDSVTSIGDSAFGDCSSLTSVTIPDGVTSIGSGAFHNCSSLTSVTIGNGVTSIGDEAFYDCSGLTSVTIPDSVTSIGSWAFSRCNGLTSVYFDGTTVPEGNDGCFYGASNLNDVYMLNITEADVQAQLDSNISKWSLGFDDSGFHTVTIHCMDGEVVIDPTPSGSSS